MMLQVYNSRGNEYVRIIESYRDPKTKQPRSRVIENFGNLENLLKTDPDALARLRFQVEEMNRNQAERKLQETHEALQAFLHKEPSGFQAPEAGFPARNYGVLLYERIWDELTMDGFLYNRQREGSRLRFDVRAPIALMTFSRLLWPDSKRATFLAQDIVLGIRPCALDELYKSLDFLAKEKENLERHLNRKLGSLVSRTLSVAFYDVTTYYFESVRKDALKAFGFSKDNKVNQVQVVMGLLIDDHGIPVSYELFPGNTNDFKTLVPVMERLRDVYGVRRLIVTADRGLNSKSNLHFLKSIGYDYVMAYKIRSATKELKDLVLDPSGYKAIGEDFRWKSADFETSVVVDGKKEHWTDHIVLTWSAKRARKDHADRERLVEKSKKLVASASRMKSEMKKGGKKYVKLTMSEENPLAFDEEQVRYDEQFDGYYGILTSDLSLKPEEVISAYRELWKIEESFRVLKSDLDARPVYVWTEKRIRGHFAVCYLALVMQRLLEHRLRLAGVEMSTERIQDALRSANVTVMEAGGVPYFLKNEAHEDFQVILETLGIEPLPVYGKLKDLRMHNTAI